MTNKRHKDKVHIGAYISKDEKKKLEQLQYEFGNLSVTEIIRMLIREQETYGRYEPDPDLKTNPDYKYPTEENLED